MVKQFRYFGTSLANRNSINEEHRNGLKKENACYHSVQNLLPSSFLSKNMKINIILNNVRQHDYFIVQGNYIGDMFQLLINHLQAYFCQLSHKMLCTHWDPIVFTFMEIHKN